MTALRRRGWRAVCMVLWVCVHVARTNDAYLDDTEAFDSRHVMRRMNERGGYERKLIPIKSPKVNGKNFASFSLPLEPDAEMLPAHYTGVKPPGVDHMELRYAESRLLKTRSEPSQADGAKAGQRASAEQESKTRVAAEGRKRVTVEKAQRGEDQTEKEKTQYAEAAGQKKTHDERDGDSKRQEEEARGSGGASHQAKDSGNKKQKALGFHNVYHKDEYKRDHDFFDNDHHGGHLKKHGRYDEKHVATEGTFKRGGSHGSGFDQAGVKKQGESGKSQADRETKGHDARRGYDGFFENFQGFANQAAKGEGRNFGFVEAKAR